MKENTKWQFLSMARPHSSVFWHLYYFSFLQSFPCNVDLLIRFDKLHNFFSSNKKKKQAVAKMWQWCMTRIEPSSHASSSFACVGTLRGEFEKLLRLRQCLLKCEPLSRFTMASIWRLTSCSGWVAWRLGQSYAAVLQAAGCIDIGHLMNDYHFITYKLSSNWIPAR